MVYIAADVSSIELQYFTSISMPHTEKMNLVRL